MPARIRRLILAPIEKILDRVVKGRTLSQIGVRFQILWNTLLAVGFLTFIIKYKLELDRYLISPSDFINERKIAQLWSERWEIIILATIYLLAFIILNKDSSKWKEQAERCFSSRNTPMKWKVVRGRYIIVWVIVSNIIIFLTAAWFINNAKIFFILFAIHHANAAIWITAFRWNVDYYFDPERYPPPKADPHKSFIARRRKVIEWYLCEVKNRERESLTAGVFVVSFSLALLNETWNITWYALPHLIAFFGECTNQLFSHDERVIRDHELQVIAHDEIERFDPDGKKRGAATKAKSGLDKQA